MNKINTKRKLIIFITGLVILVGIAYVYTKPKDIEVVNSDQITELNTLEPAYVPEGWKVYNSDLWRKDSRQKQIAFSYPSNWAIEEQRDDNNKIINVVIQGDGYKIQVDQTGNEMGKSYDYESTVGGYYARTWQSDLEDGYQLILGVIEANFIIRIITPIKDTELVAKFLSTIVFAK